MRLDGTKSHDNQWTVSCNMSGEGRQRPWEHGTAIAKALKATKIEGLSGDIRFNDEGKRINFSLDLVEMTPGSTLFKVGTWSDRDGLEITKDPIKHRGYVPIRPPSHE